MCSYARGNKRGTTRFYHKKKAVEGLGTIYRGFPTSTVSTSTISTSANSDAIGINLVLVEFLWNCYVVKIVLVEIGYVVLTSTNFA